MNRHQRMIQIRRRIARFRAGTHSEHMEDPGYAYACLADQAFLLDELVEVCRRLDHYARGPTAEFPPEHKAGETTVVTQLSPVVQRGSDVDTGWNACVVEAEKRVGAAISRAIASGLAPIETRTQAMIAVRMMARSPDPPALIAPPELPPFTIQ